MIDTFDLYYDFQPHSPKRPWLFDRSHILVEVAVPADRAKQAIGYIAVPHGYAGPDNTLDGKRIPNPFNQNIANFVLARAKREKEIAMMLGDISALTARQRKRRRQAARKAYSAQGENL